MTDVQNESNPFADLLDFSEKHRVEHGCSAHPYDKGPLLRVVTAALQPGRIIEVGTALGYSSICMADASPTAEIDTIDFDPVHVELATKHFADHGVADRVTTHCVDAAEILASLTAASYDLAFFDGFEPTASIIGRIHRLLRPGGTFICANLTQGTEGNEALSDSGRWLTHSMGETALAVKN